MPYRELKWEMPVLIKYDKMLERAEYRDYLENGHLINILLEKK